MLGLVGFKPIFAVKNTENKNSKNKKESVYFGKGHKRKYTEETFALMELLRRTALKLGLLDFYTGEHFSIENYPTIEHLLPHSNSTNFMLLRKHNLQEINDIKNIVLTNSSSNNERRAMFLTQWYKKHPAYLKNSIVALRQYEEVNIPPTLPDLNENYLKYLIGIGLSIEKYEKIQPPLINGKEWVQGLKKNLNKQMGYLAFEGNKPQKSQNLSYKA